MVKLKLDRVNFFAVSYSVILFNLLYIVLEDTFSELKLLLSSIRLLVESTPLKKVGNAVT